MKFREAIQTLHRLRRQPSSADRLQLEVLERQATEGDIRGRRPGFTDFAGRMRYDAWARLAGMSREVAERAYVSLMQNLLDKDA